MSDIVIRVEDLSKHYKLGTIGSGTLYRDIQSWWASLRGKEDPNSQVCTWNDAQKDKENSFWALKNVSFEVKQGDVVGIIGRNGAGKSTLLKILSRVTGPTTGHVKIKGRIASLLEVGTGFHPELTGRENIYLNGSILGMRKIEIDKKLDEIVAFAEIEKFLDTPVKRYSSGMYVRLAFAVAAHLDPEILIVDEVLAVGDIEFQKKCLGKMGNIRKEGRTVLFVSHNMAAIKNLCSHSIVLGKGRVIYRGTVDNGIDQYVKMSNNEKQKKDLKMKKRRSDCTLRAQIINIKINLESKKTFQGYLESEEAFYIDLVVEAKENIMCSADISISDNFGKISWFNSELMQRKTYRLLKGENVITCKIERLNLYSGEYWFNCGLSISGQEIIDLVDEALNFQILRCDPYQSGWDLNKKYGFGMVHINHTWL